VIKSSSPYYHCSISIQKPWPPHITAFIIDEAAFKGIADFAGTFYGLILHLRSFLLVSIHLQKTSIAHGSFPTSMLLALMAVAYPGKRKS